LFSLVPEIHLAREKHKMSEGIWNLYFLAFLGVLLALYWLLAPGYRPSRVQTVRRNEA
jgi:hypothetical protein